MGTKGPRASNGRSSIRPHADGHWYGFVSMGLDVTGKADRRHVRAKTQAEVTRKVRKLEKERDEGRVTTTGRAPTVETYLQAWLRSCERSGLRPSTLRGYATYMNQYAIPRLGAHRLDRLRAEHIESLYDWMAKQGRKPATIANMHRTLRSALNQAVARHLVSVSPMSGLRAPAADEKEIEPLSAEEARRLLAAATAPGTRNGARWAVALSLGLRQGEALGLQWSDLDFAAGTLTVRRALGRGTWKHGCDSPEGCGKSARVCPAKVGGGLVTGRPKSRAGSRTVSLPPSLIAVLKRHKKTQASERLRAGELWGGGNWMFATESGRPIDPRADWQAWKDLLAAAGVRNARLHDARHTAATLLLIQGVDVQTTMALMGWSQISMTTRYQHVVPELKKAAAERMESALWPERGSKNV
jgi:integrase